MAINCRQRIAGVSQVVEVEVGTPICSGLPTGLFAGPRRKSGTQQVLAPGEPFALRRLQS
jgi:hypothetical protein